MGLRFQKGDLVAIGFVLFLAVAALVLFLPNQNLVASQAEIYLDGQLLRTVPLNRDQEFTLEGEFHATVTVSGGKIAVTASDCPGADCVHSGWINSPGRSIVCLPGRLEIRVTGQSSDVDFAVG